MVHQRRVRPPLKTVRRESPPFVALKQGAKDAPASVEIQRRCTAVCGLTEWEAYGTHRRGAALEAELGCVGVTLVLG